MYIHMYVCVFSVLKYVLEFGNNSIDISDLENIVLSSAHHNELVFLCVMIKITRKENLLDRFSLLQKYTISDLKLLVQNVVLLRGQLWKYTLLNLIQIFNLLATQT